MLKFFRKYNKWILGIGGSLLMVIFLIQPVMSMFQPDINKQVRGTYDGGEITLGDIRAASADLAILQRFGLFLDPDPQEPSGGRDPIRWALILKDAQRLGLNASNREVTELQLRLGQSDADVEMLASRLNVTTGYVRQALRRWLIVQTYKELMAGQIHMPGAQRAELLRQALQNRESAGFYEAMAYGSSRLSKPLIEHFLQDQGAQVEGRVVLIPAEKFLGETPAPSEQEVIELFEEYKDDLPGRGEPYGFGYRIPDRVKVEYLAIPFDEALRVVRVTEADALAHYRDHPERFSTTAPDGTQGDPRPYDQIRGRVVEDLKQQRAFELVEKMAKTAYGYLYEDTRGLPRDGDYRLIDDLGQLTPLRQIADRLEEEFGLLPQVYPAGDWVNADELPNLPGIGQSRLADNIKVDFRSYVLSAKELEPDKDNPLLPRRLQVGLVSAPTLGMDGSRYLFRLTDAQPTRLPASIDEVRDRVQRDAHLLAAYKRLLGAQQSWREIAVEEGLEAVAEKAETTVVTLPPTPRRVPLPNGLLIVPPLPAVGQSEVFIDAYFETANRALEDGDVTQADPDKATGVVGLDRRLALAVFRVDDYQPLTKEQLQNSAENPILPLIIDTTALIPARMENPLSYQALVKRLNYKEEGEEDSAEETGEGNESQTT